jgi:NAD(P)-dependent dehydrogenase (short-subunit alcohol dehydrogenase family)
VAFNQYEYAAYLLAKKTLAEFTLMAALEYAPRFRVNGVMPGVTMPLQSRSKEYIQWRLDGIPLRRQGTTADIVGAVRYLLDSPFVNGQLLYVDGGEAMAHIGRNATQYDPSKI